MQEGAATTAHLNGEVRRALITLNEDNSLVHKLSARNFISVTPSMLSRLCVPEPGQSGDGWLDDRILDICVHRCLQTAERVALVGKSNFFYPKLVPDENGHWAHRPRHSTGLHTTMTNVM